MNIVIVKILFQNRKKYILKLTIFFSLCSFIGLSFPVNSEIYMWKDENGKTHFGDKKIEDANQQTVDIKFQESEWKKYVIEINDVDNVLTDQEKDRIQNDVDTVYQFFDKKLYFDIYKTVPVKIRLYGKEEGYLRYLSDEYKTNGKHSRGVYFPSKNEIVTFINVKERWRTFWTIKHESSHAIVDTLTPFLPAWLDEGLAENMEALGLKSNSFILQMHSENHHDANQAYLSGWNFDIETFLSTSSDTFYAQLEQGGSPNQANTGELVRMFLSTNPGRGFIIHLIHVYERGSLLYSSYVADEHYIGGLKVMQDDWSRWVARPVSKDIEL